MIIPELFAGRRVAIVGMARSGLAAALALRAGGAEIACWDDGERGRAAASAQGLPLVDLITADWSRFAALVLSPGIPLTHPKPHWTVERARAADVEVIGDTEMFFRSLARCGSPRPRVVGITGTNGKSTTTALTAHLLREAGLRMAMGGNIGEAVLGLAPFADTDVYVLELSSYQIDLTPSPACDVGILLNISPDHLDRHGTLETYAAVKERLVATATTAIIGLDDVLCRDIAIRRLSGGQHHRTTIGLHVLVDPTRPAAAVRPADIHAFVERDGALVNADSGDFIGSPPGNSGLPTLSLAGAQTLRGPHNAQNAAAAASAAMLLGVAPSVIQRGLLTYPGLAHRMELLGTLYGKNVINDSKATNADATAKALSSWGSGLHWIVGGQPKEGGIDSLVLYFKYVKRAYLIGDAAADFDTVLKKQGVDTVIAGTLERAVAMVADFARANQAGFPTGAILFSPACASFDQFRDFEHRGDEFRALVAASPGFVPLGQEPNPA